MYIYLRLNEQWQFVGPIELIFVEDKMDFYKLQKT